MKIQIGTDKISQLTTLTLSGELDFNELLSSIETVHKKSGHTRKCLWDFRSVIGGESVSVLQIGKFYGLCNKYFYGQGNHKIAFLVSGELGFGFAQAMSTFEECYDVYLNVRAFKKHQDAMNWLEEESE